MWYRQFQPSEDVDADGLPDGWELWHWGTTTQTVGLADSDLDGWSNAQEYVADTDPTNNRSFFPPLCWDGAGSGLRLIINPTSTNRTYYIDFRTNLLDGTWESLTNAIGNGTGLNMQVAPTDANQYFFRSRVTIP
jgi:hypothetical protein